MLKQLKQKLGSNEKGLSILEVMIAMVILGISLLLLLNMAMVALDGNDWSNKTTVSTQLLQEKLEQMRTITNLSSAYSGSDTAQGMTRIWRVSHADNHLQRVDVVVRYDDIKGQQVENSMTAYIKTDSI